MVRLGSVAALALGASIVDAKLQPLKFKKDGSFHVSVFEDLHFGDCSYISIPNPVAVALTLPS